MQAWQWQAGSSSSDLSHIEDICSNLSHIDNIHSNLSCINNTSSHNCALNSSNSNSIHCHDLTQAAPLVLIAALLPSTHAQDLNCTLHAQTRTLRHHRQQMTVHHTSLVEL